MSKIIDEALDKFKGILSSSIQKDKDGNELRSRLDEPIVTYIIGDG